MALARMKHPTIYDTVREWHDNSTGVPYIAHAILADGAAIALLNNPVTGTGNQNLSSHHPDQMFWSNNEPDIRYRLTLRGTRAIARIEIDCALLPCTGTGGCVFRVPALITAVSAVLASVPLRIFSHRDEHLAKQNDPSTKRCFDANSADTNTNAMQRYNAHQGWGWVAMGLQANYV